MKKIAIVMFVVAAALAGCGKKKSPDAPATPAGDTGSAAPAGDTAGSGEAGAGGDTAGSAAPAEGGGM